MRLPPPPGAGATQADIARLKTFNASDDAGAWTQTSFRDTGSLAMWDQTITSHDAKVTYWRGRPSLLDSTAPLLFPSPGHPS